MEGARRLPILFYCSSDSLDTFRVSQNDEHILFLHVHIRSRIDEHISSALDRNDGDVIFSSDIGIDQTLVHPFLRHTNGKDGDVVFHLDIVNDAWGDQIVRDADTHFLL